MGSFSRLLSSTIWTITAASGSAEGIEKTADGHSLSCYLFLFLYFEGFYSSMVYLRKGNSQRLGIGLMFLDCVTTVTIHLGCVCINK